MNDGTKSVYPTTVRHTENYMDVMGNGRSRQFSSLEGGITLREHYIGLAIAGLCSNPNGPINVNTRGGWGLGSCKPDFIAGMAVDIADAALKALQ